jgi:hypothetical protein
LNEINKGKSGLRTKHNGYILGYNQIYKQLDMIFGCDGVYPQITSNKKNRTPGWSSMVFFKAVNHPKSAPIGKVEHTTLW